MSNRDALRKLSKMFPGDDEVKSIIASLHKESDRTVAIVGASLIESALEAILIRSFTARSKDLLDRIFQNRGPLSDFNSKILVAQAFGVISTPTAGEMQRIRHIRNVFAHARVNVSFDTPEIAREVEEFVTLLAMKSVKLPDIEDHPLQNLNGKPAFLLICKILLIIYSSSHEKLGGDGFISE